MNDWIRVAGAENPVEASFLGGLLEAAGIEVRLRRMELWTAAVEIYFVEDARPSVWVKKRDAERAREVLRERGRSDRTDWTCPGCGEQLEGQFTACWRCGRAREDDA